MLHGHSCRFSAAWLFSAHTHRAEQLTWIRIRSNPTGKWETDVATKGFSMRKVSPTVHPMLMSMLWSLFATKVISTTWCDLPLAWWQTKNDDGSSKPRVFLCLTSSIFSTFLLRINFRRVFFSRSETTLQVEFQVPQRPSSPKPEGASWWWGTLGVHGS